jgi:hypothetical protein
VSKSTSRAGEQHEVGSLALTTEEGWEGGLINNRGIESKLDSRKSGDVSTGLVEGRSEDHKNEIYFPCDVAATRTWTQAFPMHRVLKRLWFVRCVVAKFQQLCRGVARTCDKTAAPNRWFALKSAVL